MWLEIGFNSFTVAHVRRIGRLPALANDVVGTRHNCSFSEADFRYTASGWV